jgi:hypothetical protein
MQTFLGRAGANYMQNLRGDLAMVYNISSASVAVGKTRQALQAAIKKGTISARKNDLGEWEIDPAELHRVYPPVKPQAQLEGQGLQGDTQMQMIELRCKLEASERLLDEARTRAEDLKQERDGWKRQAEELLNQVKALPAGEGQRKGFFVRLFGGQ